MLLTHDRFDILDCKVSMANTKTATDAVSSHTKSAEGRYVCFSNAHTVVTSKKDVSLSERTSNSFLSMSDGKLLSIFA